MYKILQVGIVTKLVATVVGCFNIVYFNIVFYIVIFL